MNPEMIEIKRQVDEVVEADEIPQQLTSSIAMSDVEDLIAELIKEEISNLDKPASQETLHELISRVAIRACLVCIFANTPEESSISLDINLDQMMALMFGVIRHDPPLIHLNLVE